MHTKRLACRILVAFSLAIGLSPVMVTFAASPADATCTTSTPVVPPAGITPYFNEFSSLNDTTPDPTISNEMRSLINSADSGSKIYLSGFLLLDPGTVSALINAHDCRGVIEKVVLDSGNESHSQPTSLASDLNTAASQAAGSFLMYCPTNAGCMSHEAGSIDHNKFMALSSVDGHKDIVFQSSANFMVQTSGDGWWNNAVVVNDGSAQSSVLYDSYVQYLTDLASHAPAGAATGIDYFHDGQTVAQRTDDATNTKTYFSPEQNGDFILGVLGNVTCATGQDTLDGKTNIRVAMSIWKDTRGAAIAQKLVSLQDAGCNVNVIFRSDADSNVVPWLTTKKDGIDAYYFCHSVNGITDAANLHDKYLLIAGEYSGVPDQRIVLTGSQNYTDNGLQWNDETDLKITDRAIYNSYHDNFKNMRALLVNAGRVTSGQTTALNCSG